MWGGERGPGKDLWKEEEAGPPLASHLTQLDQGSTCDLRKLKPTFDTCFILIIREGSQV